MKAIVAADKNWAIGRNGDLLAHLPGDMKFFKENTIGRVVVMGRKTLESFPGGRPLKDRVNIVMTSAASLDKDVVICHSVDELASLISEYDQDDVFVIGGGTIYSQLIDTCSEALVTKIDAEFDADTYFPDLDSDPAWELVSEGEEKEDNGIKYAHCLYRRNESEHAHC